MAETDAAGAIKWKYTWGPGTDNLVGVQDSTGTPYYVVQDQLGSVRGLVKRDGTWIMSQRFLPSGQLLVRDSAGAAMPRGFPLGWTGREYDAETGLSFHRARYYSPEQRRWTQEDPTGYGGGSNLYAYVGGAVLASRDPSGMIGEVVSTSAIENPQDPSIRVPDPVFSGLGGHQFGVCWSGDSDFCSVNTHLNCTVYNVDGSCATHGDPNRYYGTLPRADRHHDVVVTPNVESSASGGTTYSWTVTVTDSRGRPVARFDGSIFPDQERDACRPGGRCPHVLPGAYQFTYDIFSHKKPRYPALWIGSVPSSRGNDLVGVWIHSGGVSTTGSEGCITVESRGWQAFMRYFPPGANGFVHVRY